MKILLDTNIIIHREASKGINPDMTRNYSGITEDYFYQYFSEREDGFAIKIKNVKKYRQPKCLKADFNLLPPQSFAYYIK